MARHLFTSESVTEGHPDKICDQISDSILDALLENDPHARVACETTVTTGLVLVAGEISTNTYVDIPKLVRKTVKEIGYDRAKYGFDSQTCAVITAIDEQSSDIAMGVDEALESRSGEQTEEEIEAIGTFAILRRGGVDVDLYAVESDDKTGRFGMTCTNLKPLAEFNANDYQAIVLPGGPGFKVLEANETVKAAIKTFDAEDKLVCAICAGPTVLGRLGYLKGKKYTCFTAMNDDFGGDYQYQYVVKDGHFITGRSAAATIDFGFAILEALCGKKADANNT